MRYVILILPMMFVACAVTPPSTSEVESDLCTIEDQEAGLCGATGAIAAYGDGFIADNYSDVAADPWRCTPVTSTSYGSCDRDIYRADYTRLRVWCWQHQDNDTGKTITSCIVITYD